MVVQSTAKKQFVRLAGIALVGGCIMLWLVNFSDCAKKPKNQKAEISYSLATAELVSQVTSGLVPATAPIQVRFVNAIIPANRVHTSLPASVFAFEPEINGTVQWQDDCTLAFKPEQPLPLRQQFRAKLNLAQLQPDLKEKGVSPLEFQFTVAGRELANLSGDFRLLNENNPNFLRYEGVISFTIATDLAKVQEAVRLKCDGKMIPLSWRTDPNHKDFAFTSPTLERSHSEQKFLFTVDKNPLELLQDYEKQFSLTPITEMKVINLEKREAGDKTSVVVQFSDELDPQKDFRGWINVEPAVDVHLKAIGKELHISGEFQYGRSYTLTVNRGIRSRWGTITAVATTKTIEIEDIKPQFCFASSGVFLPSANEQKVNFMTVNLRRVTLTVQKVFESNLGQFIQTQKLTSPRNRDEDFDSYELKRVGVDLVTDTLEIGMEKNRWLQHELDLKKIIPAKEKGLFLLSLYFNSKDMLYGSPEEVKEWEQRRRNYYGDDYYTNPFSSGYIYRHGKIFKPIILSDIGLTYKRADQCHLIFATNILDASPLNDVKVTLNTYQNQLIAQGKTDRDGKAEFDNIDQEVFYITAEKDGQRSVIKLNEMAWNLSGFDTGGEDVSPGGIRAFIYSERGVYRPGDEINLSLIARNQDNTFPDNHPVTLQVFNPKDQKVFEQTQKDGKDGFYNFKFRTDPADPTGGWQAKLLVGSKTFVHPLKIETVVPYRLKVKLMPAKEKLDWSDRSLKVDLAAAYLFGNPAADLAAEVKVTLTQATKTFTKFKDFVFSNQAVDYQPQSVTVFQGNLDAEGKVAIDWPLPEMTNAPTAMTAAITAKVFEKGGRPNQNIISVPIDPYANYVGIKNPAAASVYPRVGSAMQIPVVLVNNWGEAVLGRDLNYRIFKNNYYWWWEYEDNRDFQLRFKSDQNTQLVTAGTLNSGTEPVILDFTPEDQGEYLIEVQDGNTGGHCAGFFLRAHFWGEIPAGGDQADLLMLKTDKPSYHPGDKAIISFPAPREGAVLVTVEKAYTIVSAKWYKADGNSAEMKITVPITTTLLPNAYVAVTIIQPHSQTRNDRPIRMYGVIPLLVEDPVTRQELQIITEPELAPNQPFTVKLQTADHKPTQFTLAIVDEGLLDLTGFVTPNPWQNFYKKERLGVSSYDLFSYIIGANKGDIFKTFAIGGELEAAYRAAQMGAESTRRFKPVALFRGPLTTNSDGAATVKFDMPNYIGSVRIMAIAAQGKHYSSTEKTVAVKSDLMVMPTLPRVLGPEDQFILPVTVFAARDNLGQVNVSLETEGPVRLLDEPSKSLLFTTKDEKDVRFIVQADAAVGTAKFKITAKSANQIAIDETELAVRASSPRIYTAEKKDCLPGATLSFLISNQGLPGTNAASLKLQSRPFLNLSNRLFWLIHYPYGCIEQTVSAVFPQLYLKKLITTEKYDDAEIDRNINAGISKMRQFQLPSGAFCYWPGGNTFSVWGSNYGGHFLLEAKKLGYSVPPDLLARWLRFQKSQALTTQDNLLERVNRVYLLALAGEPQLGAMNLLKENSLADMNDTQKWLLAAAYRLAGVDKTAQEILKNTGTTVSDYSECGGTYGSGLRDQAIILALQVLFERWREADNLAEQLAQQLATDNWYSTQTTGYVLLALGKYLQAIAGKIAGAAMIGEIRLPGGKTIPFNTTEMSHNLELTNGFGKPLEIFLDQRSTVKRLFATLEWNGVPLKSDLPDTVKNLTLAVEWLDENGLSIDPTNLKQGRTFWGHFQVGKTSSFGQSIEELALVQILPAGWEIENIRLTDEAQPAWMAKWRLQQEDYLDIRDDRIMWFFDLPVDAKPLDFVVKLNTVTAGKFQLPSTSLEAMYNHLYLARKAGKKVTVTTR